ncbi:MAG: beta-lactamase family protein, partial [Hyphomonadaceae bacterium]|nr:beta-lactamase family protein [Hyphomonadaceae bacterium]
MIHSFRFGLVTSLVALAGCTVQDPPAPEADLMPAAPPAEAVAPLAAPVFSADWPAPYEEAKDAPFNPAALEALEARMAQFVTDGDVMGIATLLVHDGAVVSHMQAGIRREADKAPITPDTIYRIYSMTKPVTGVAMMILHEE